MAISKVVSIEITDFTTKVCEVSYGKKVATVYNSLAFDNPENAIEDAYVIDKDRYVNELRSHLKDAKIRTKEAVFVLACNKILSREVIIPDMKEKEIGYITITGSRNIWNKMITMIEEAEKRIYFSASLPVIEQLGEEFTKVLDRKIKLVFITDGMPKEDSFMKDAICYIGDARENSVRLIIDSEYALTGELTGKKDDTCLYTGQDNFIRVFKEALRNEMKLIELTEGENKNE